MPKIDPMRLPPTKVGSDYPSPFDRPVAARIVRDLSAAAGVTDWTANYVVVPPGCWSSQRHWHEEEDEIVVVLAGEAVLIDDRGRTPIHMGDIALFRKGDGNGHHFVNEREEDFVFVALSRPEQGLVHYPDIDLQWSQATGDMHRDGTPY